MKVKKHIFAEGANYILNFLTFLGDEEQGDGTRNASHHLHSAHSLFPSCLCAAVIQIVNMLDDASVSSDGNAVYEVAYQVNFNLFVKLVWILEHLVLN